MDVPVTYECGCTETITSADPVLVELYDSDYPVEVDGPCFECGEAAWRQLAQLNLKARGANSCQ